MAAGQDIFIRILVALDDSDDVVVLDRTPVEMVANVKLELENVLSLDFLFDYVKLGLIQADITNRRKILHGDIVAVCPVIHDTEGHLGGAYETSYSGLDHLLVERSYGLLVRNHLFRSIPVSVVVHPDLGVLAVDLLILFDDLSPGLVSLI